MVVTPSACLTDETIDGLLSRSITKDARTAALAHLDACARCRAILSARVTVSTDPESDSEAQPRRGDHVGRYRLEGVLGAGGMGVVYRAYDPVLEREVALKLLHTQHASDRQRLAEARAMARVRHPNVVAVYDAGEHDGRVFVVMELFEGTTLSARLAEQPPPREILALFGAAAEGLAAAHAAGLVHKDFKPDNVLVDPRDRVAVTDFGLATDPGHGESPGGTLAYMAPEQRVPGGPVDARADVFSFCVALQQALGAPGAERAPAPRSRAPAWLRKELARGLAHDPRQRPEDMRALSARLHAGVQRDRRRARTLGAVAAGLGIAVVSTVVARAWRSEVGCEAGLERLRAIIDVQVEEQLRISPSAEDGAPYALLSRSLDDFAAQWRSAHLTLCRQSRGDPTAQSATAAQRACLDDQLEQLQGVLRVAWSPDNGGVANAGQALQGLPWPAACASATDAADPSTHEARRDMTHARVLLAAGRYGEVVELLRPWLQPDVGRAESAFGARLTLAYGEALLQLASFAEGKRHLTRALELADSAGDDETRLAALTLLIDWASRSGQLEEGRAYERAAAPVLERVRTSAQPLPEEELARLEGGLYLAGGRVHHLLGESTEARRLLGLALARFLSRRHGENHPNVAQVLDVLSATTFSTASAEECEWMLERSLAIRERTLGADHPDLAFTIINIGTLLRGLDRGEQALSYYDRGLAIRRRAFGEVHPRVAVVHQNIGYTLLGLGRFDEARQAFAAAERGYAPLGPGSRELGLLHLDRATLLAEEERYAEGLSECAAARRLLERAPAEHRWRADLCLASALLNLDRIPEARLAILGLEPLPGPQKHHRGRYALVQARLWLREGEVERAREGLRTALRDLRGTLVRSPIDIQLAEHLLAGLGHVE